MVACEKSWAGRVVIGFQLLSWCAVGGLLLHRGITSIKEDHSPSSPKYGNVQTNFTQLIFTNKNELEKPTSLKSKLAEQSTVLKVHLQPKQRVSGNSLDKEDGNWTRPESDEVWVSETWGNETSTPDKMPHNVRVASAPPRKNLILTPSGVVMAALGAIMLILGPSIVILRCCDAGSRGRFSKLYSEDPSLALSAMDRPPAYEDVVESTPRYSALFPDDVVITEVTPTHTASHNISALV